MFAAEYGFVEVVRLLLSHKANVDTTNCTLNTALIEMCTSPPRGLSNNRQRQRSGSPCHRDMVKVLID